MRDFFHTRNGILYGYLSHVIIGKIVYSKKTKRQILIEKKYFSQFPAL